MQAREEGATIRDRAIQDVAGIEVGTVEPDTGVRERSGVQLGLLNVVSHTADGAVTRNRPCDEDDLGRVLCQRRPRGCLCCHLVLPSGVWDASSPKSEMTILYFFFL